MFLMANTLGEFTGHATGIMFSYPEITAIAERIILRLEELEAKGLFITPLPYCLASRTAITPSGTCSACRDSAQINMDGSISPCASLTEAQFRSRIPIWDRDASSAIFSQTAENFMAFQKHHIPQFCQQCSLFSQCKAACAVTWSNEIRGNDPANWDATDFADLHRFRETGPLDSHQWPRVYQEIPELSAHVVTRTNGKYYLRFDGARLFDNLDGPVPININYLEAEFRGIKVVTMPIERLVFYIPLAQLGSARLVGARFWSYLLASPVVYHLRDNVARAVVAGLSWKEIPLIA
jgi:radical SAM protein with 4Fe4S-binding SPASM domain